MARRGRAQPVRSWWVAPPAAPASPSDDPSAVRPTVVTQDGPITAPMVGYTAIKTMVSPPERQLVLPVIVGAQQSPNHQTLPYVFAERPFATAVAAPTGTPFEPIVVRAIELPWTPPQVFVARTAFEGLLDVTPSVPTIALGAGLVGGGTTLINRAPQPAVVVSGTPPLPTIVGAGPVPVPAAFVLVASTKTEPPAAPVGTPARPTVVTSSGPVSAPFVGQVWLNSDSGIAPTGQQGPAPVVVRQMPLPELLPFVTVSRTPVAPPVAPGVITTPTVVGQATPPQALPFVSAPQVKAAPLAAAPDVQAIRPVTVTALEPLPPTDNVVLWAMVNQDGPTRVTVVDAEPLPLSKPFVFVSDTPAPFVAPPAVPVAPIVVASQPVPPAHGQSRAAHGFAEAPAPTEVPVPIRPTVVNAQPYPQPVQNPWAVQPKVAPPPPPQIVMRPTIVNAQPLPTPYVQSPWVSYTEADPPQVPVQPIVVGQQPIPPQTPFTATPKGGRWGFPPPTHRVIQPQVITDMSLPFRPNGWVRVAHGFAEALPLLYEGAVVGGTIEGPRVSGGVMTGSGIGGTIQNGYVTGGVR